MISCQQSVGRIFFADKRREKMLTAEWKQDQIYTLADPAPWNLSELKQAADVADPRAVAAYYVWSVTRMTDNREDGLAMMKFTVSRFEDSDRWYVTSGASASGLFYDQRSAAGVNHAKQETTDDSTQEEHTSRYAGAK